MRVKLITPLLSRVVYALCYLRSSRRPASRYFVLAVALFWTHVTLALASVFALVLLVAVSKEPLSPGAASALGVLFVLEALGALASLFAAVVTFYKTPLVSASSLD